LSPICDPKAPIFTTFLAIRQILAEIQGAGCGGTGGRGRLVGPAAATIDRPGVAMSDVLLSASLLVTLAIASAILLRTIAVRRVQARQERMKEHLDWINPVSRTGRKRGSFRR
jgi:hypothetical protein